MKKESIITLHPDSKWKESSMSKLEIALDDRRNDVSELMSVDGEMEYGKTYKVAITVELSNEN